jgi:hypothetical protein
MFDSAKKIFHNMRSTLLPSSLRNTVSTRPTDGELSLSTSRTFAVEDASENEESDVELPPPLARASPCLSAISIGTHMGGIDLTKLEQLKILFVENRKGRFTPYAQELNATLGPNASKFDFYCRQAIPGLFLQRFFRSPQDALTDLQNFVVRLEICDATFFMRWRTWRSSKKTALQTQRGRDSTLGGKALQSGGPNPTNDRRWMDMYISVRKIALSNWILFFEYPSSRIFLNALQHSYGNLYRNSTDEYSYYELEWNRKTDPMFHKRSLNLWMNHTIEVVNEGLLLGILVPNVYYFSYLFFF